MQPIQEQDHALEVKLIAQYEENMTKLTEFYRQRAKNIGQLKETGTLIFFIMPFKSARDEIVLYPLKMLMEIIFLILKTLHMNLLIISKIFSTPLLLRMADRS
jgi:hypothetical protein